MMLSLGLIEEGVCPVERQCDFQLETVGNPLGLTFAAFHLEGNKVMRCKDDEIHFEDEGGASMM